MGIKLVKEGKRTIKLGNDNSFEPRLLEVSCSYVDGSVTFTELCDEYYSVTASKEEAISALLKIIEHINTFDASPIGEQS